VTPVIFIAFSLWLVANTAFQQPLDAGVGAALILAGLPVYFLRRYWAGGGVTSRARAS